MAIALASSIGSQTSPLPSHRSEPGAAGFSVFRAALQISHMGVSRSTGALAATGGITSEIIGILQGPSLEP